MRRKGCSGTTFNSTKRICDSNGLGWVLSLRNQPCKPLLFKRSLLLVIELKRRCCRSFSSSLSKGRTTSRLTVPGSCIKQPRITSVPCSFALPFSITDCDVFAGRIACDGVHSKATPDALGVVVVSTEKRIEANFLTLMKYVVIRALRNRG